MSAPRLDDGGESRVDVLVAGVLSFVVLKIQAFQQRHENKDAYDLVFTLVNYPGAGPAAAGETADRSLAGEPEVQAALTLLEERFADVKTDGPVAYAAFLHDPLGLMGRHKVGGL